MPGTLGAQGWIFSSWTRTEQTGTAHSLDIHVCSIARRIPVPRSAAHVSGTFLFVLTVTCRALARAWEVSVCHLPPSLLRALCPRARDLLSFLKPSKVFALRLGRVCPQVEFGSGPHALQAPAQREPSPRGLPRPGTSPSSFLICFLVAQETSDESFRARPRDSGTPSVRALPACSSVSTLAHAGLWSNAASTQG